MSKETLEYHHDKHHQAYVTNGNNLLKGTEFEGKSLEEIVKGSFGKNAPLFNNAGQHYNHLHFWNWMKPNGGGSKLPGRLEKKITEDLGGLEKFKTDFAAAGVGQFGSGWAWLSVKNGNLQDAQWRKPAGAWRHADPRRRRLGALLLHRLSQSPSGLFEGVCRSPGELGVCRRAVLEGLTLQPRILTTCGAAALSCRPCHFAPPFRDPCGDCKLAAKPAISRLVLICRGGKS
jgi:hypothetical protein